MQRSTRHRDTILQKICPGPDAGSANTQEIRRRKPARLRDAHLTFVRNTTRFWELSLRNGSVILLIASGSKIIIDKGRTIRETVTKRPRQLFAARRYCVSATTSSDSGCDLGTDPSESRSVSPPRLTLLSRHREAQITRTSFSTRPLRFSKTTHESSHLGTAQYGAITCRHGHAP